MANFLKILFCRRWNHCSINGKFFGADGDDCKFSGDKFMCDMAHPVYRAHRISKKQIRHALTQCKASIKDKRNIILRASLMENIKTAGFIGSFDIITMPACFGLQRFFCRSLP